MTVDVVVVTWRSPERLRRCLENLARQTIAHHLVVVDNDADGDGAEMAARIAPKATVLRMPENPGFGRAVNAGVAAGSGEAIVLVNDDLYCEPDFVESIVAPLAQERVGMVAGLSLKPDGEIDGFGIELDPTLTAYNRLRHQPAEHARAGARSHAGVLAGPSGGAAAYSRRAWEEAGGFDGRLFAYGEDVDLALRLRSTGWAAAEAVAACGVHEGGASFGVDSPRQRELAGFARGFLVRRYGLLRTRHAVRTILFEAIIVLWGLLRFRTLAPARGRMQGWRAARGARLQAPQDAIDRSIGMRRQLQRARTGR